MLTVLVATTRDFAMQNDSTARHLKDLDVVLGGDKAALIMDDSAHVWPRHRQNVIHMDR